MSRLALQGSLFEVDDWPVFGGGEKSIFYGGRGRTEHERAGVKHGKLRGNAVGAVARSAIAFVGLVVTLVNNDESDTL